MKTRIIIALIVAVSFFAANVMAQTPTPVKKEVKIEKKDVKTEKKEVKTEKKEAKTEKKPVEKTEKKEKLRG